MMTNKIDFKKERDLSETINATFEFLRENFKPLFFAMLYVSGPFILIELILASLFPYSSFDRLKEFDQNSLAMNLILIAVSAFLFIFLYFLVMVAVVNQYIIFYIEKGKDNFTTNDIVKAILPKTPGLILIYILVFFSSMIAVLLCFLPVIFVAPTLTLIFMAYMYEKRNPLSAYSRCFELISTDGSISFGKWGTLFGVGFIAGLAQGAISYIFTLPMSLLLIAIPLLSTSSPNEKSVAIVIVYVAYYAVSIVVSAFLNSITIVANSLYFFSLKEQKEGTSLVSKIDQFDNLKPLRNDEESY